MTIDHYGPLPMFPVLYHRPDYPLSEDRIEREAERLIDRADAAFLAGRATQEQYDLWNIALNRWTREHYAYLRARQEVAATGWTAPTPWPETSRDDAGFTYVKPSAA